MREAWRLRTEAGLTWAEIAATVGYSSEQNAMRAVRRWRGSVAPLDVARMRDEAIARAEWLLRMAAEDVVEDRAGSVTAMVRVEQRLAQLIGLDAPQRIDTTHTEHVTALFAWLAEPTTSASPPPWELPA